MQTVNINEWEEYLKQFWTEEREDKAIEMDNGRNNEVDEMGFLNYSGH
jgi:hypothetical protein